MVRAIRVCISHRRSRVRVDTVPADSAVLLPPLNQADAAAKSGGAGAEVPAEPEELTVFVQNLLQQMVRKAMGAANHQRGRKRCGGGGCSSGSGVDCDSGESCGCGRWWWRWQWRREEGA